jgi:adenylate cyclase class 2
MFEVETKVLEIDQGSVKKKLASLGAKPVSDTKLSVSWFAKKGLQHNGDDPWYLRVRRYSEGQPEVTWKAKSEALGVSRKLKEINFHVEDADKMSELLQILDLEIYAQQEKFRSSWLLQDWRFEIDQYPNMPAYMEIEGQNEEHIKQAVKLLGLENYETNSGGERRLIQDRYKLNWYNLKFK